MTSQNMSRFLSTQPPFVDIQLSTQLTEALPPTPPSSPRYSLTRQDSYDLFSVRPLLDEVWSANFDLENSTKPPGVIRPYTIPSYETPPSSDEGNEEEKELLEPPHPFCQSPDETTNSTRIETWSQRSSSCNQTETATEDCTSNDDSSLNQTRLHQSSDEDGTSNDECSLNQTRLHQSSDEDGTSNDECSLNQTRLHQSSDEDDQIPFNLRRSEWPAHTRYFYSTECSPPSRSPILKPPPSVYRSNAIRARQQPSSPLTSPRLGSTTPQATSKLIKEPPPSRLPTYSPLSSPVAYHSASNSLDQPSTPASPVSEDPNQRSFMDFDDSDADDREKYSSASLSRLWDKKRKGQSKRRFRRSLSEVWGVLSCSKN